MFEACFKHTDIVVLSPESEPDGEKVMSSKHYAVSDVPAMSAERVFILLGLDRSRPLRLMKTEEIVEYRGYTPTYQLIVHPINHEDPYYLLTVGLSDLENVPEPGVAYIKVSDQPFDGSTKMRMPFVFDEDILSSLKK